MFRNTMSVSVTDCDLAIRDCYVHPYTHVNDIFLKLIQYLLINPIVMPNSLN